MAKNNNLNSGDLVKLLIIFSLFIMIMIVPLGTVNLNWEYNMVILIVCSIIIAIPVVIISMDLSRRASWYLYGRVTRLIHAHSPAIKMLDKNKVPIVDYGYQAGNNYGKQRNPLTIAVKANTYYEEFSKTYKPNKKEYFFNCIHWLEESKIDKDNYSLWPYEFGATAYDVSLPFYSALAQTAIMVAFMHAFTITADEHYKIIADKALRSLEVPIEKGGVLVVDPNDGGKWYEEIAFGGGKKQTPLILNGCLSSILYLHEYYKQTNSKEAKVLFDDGLIEIKRHLPDYDNGHWTNYDREGHFAYDYHYIHVHQLQELYEITGDKEFKVYHDKWAAYFPINPMWVRERFAAYLFDASIIFIILAIMMIIYKMYKI